MEVISNSIEDKLIDGLNYKLEATASYITERKSSTFWAMGSNIYAPNSGTKVIKLVLSSEGWLDPSTVVVQFDVKNLENQALRTLSGPWSFFRRMRVLCQGELLEDIDYYNRTHQMFDVLQSKHVRDNEDIEGFGYRYDSEYGKGLIENPLTKNPDGSTKRQDFLIDFSAIDANSSRTVSFKPLSGILNQGKLLPLRYAPITIELEVVNNLYEPIVSFESPGFLAGVAGAQSLAEFQTDYGMTQTLYLSNKWQIENPQIKCDICRMDNQLENEFAQKFNSGQSIAVNYSTYVVQQQSLAGQSPTLNITRALSKLKSVFLTLTGKTADGADAAFDTLGYYENAFLKSWNDFYHPMAWDNNYTANGELEVSLQIGSKKFPDYPLRTVSEQFSALRKCMGIHGSTFHSIDMDTYQYRTHKYIVGIDTEKVLQASFSGENLKSGSLLTLMMKNIGSDSARYPTSAFVTMHCDCIMNIRDVGVEKVD